MENETRPQGDCRSDLKVLVGKKKGIMEVEETSENSHKRVKMRALDSVFRSETQAGKGGSIIAHSHVNSDSEPFDLNVNVGSVNGKISDDTPAFIKESSNLMKSKGLDLNLNADDISSSDPFHPYKNYEHLKSRDESECGSSVGPVEEKDSLKVWKGLKQNNFMSAPYGSAPIPKPRGRKKSDDVMKKKMELAKKEQVDRFARVAAPSGLLNGLNPGIINHVRNSKQVHSIIEALVKSEKAENLSKNVNQIKSHRGFLSGRREMSDFRLLSELTEVVRGDGDSYMSEKMNFSRMTSSKCNFENENDGLALKLSSTSENASCLSNEESANLSSVSSLSVKGANVASQWLELLNHDIRGRLSALRRSKKRVQAVITTELPFLISREFSHNEDKTTVDAHSLRWNTLFGQMDKALSEEESHLETWLNQVKEMQLHCERGLCTSSSIHPPHQTGSIGNDARSVGDDNSEKDLAVRAAAASIYSTCNFLLTSTS
ncbi:hypothetical protein ACJIZ3_022413 [Penstemon smallii]|uniref:Uncharacterized protein n=1 Tax=Penstemon smallii TaxID=265156 RepID=A0ABD3TM34_9LAMI